MLSKRPPVIVVMGHVDHGKSTLLDFIRKTNTVGREAGGITQTIAAYVAIHKDEEGKEREITFIDTPGHAAYSSMRSRGATVADIAILVVAADDGVKPQTVEALKAIEKAGIPYIVALNKIDKPGANVDKAKQSLAEHGIYLEGYGGEVPMAAISAKTGEGIPELLSLVLLSADLKELTADPDGPTKGIIIESHKDPRRGVGATLIVLDGSLSRGNYIFVGKEIAAVRTLVDAAGKPALSVTAGKPALVSGFADVPDAGEEFRGFGDKKEAQTALDQATKPTHTPQSAGQSEEKEIILPLVVKVDTFGRLEAVLGEISKCENEKVGIKIVVSGVGAINESDIKGVLTTTKPLIIGFGVSADKSAIDLAARHGLTLEIFDIIYKLSEWLAKYIAEVTPKEITETIVGEAKILKTFSRTKEKQIVGGKVTSGRLEKGKKIRIMRREAILGEGRLGGLQSARKEVSEVPEGEQFGAAVESKITIAAGDVLQILTAVENGGGNLT